MKTEAAQNAPVPDKAMQNHSQNFSIFPFNSAYVIVACGPVEKVMYIANYSLPTNFIATFIFGTRTFCNECFTIFNEL